MVSQGKLKGFKVGLGISKVQRHGTQDFGSRISTQWYSVLNVFRAERDESYFFPKALAILLCAAETEWPGPTGSRVRVKRG